MMVPPLKLVEALLLKFDWQIKSGRLNKFCVRMPLTGLLPVAKQMSHKAGVLRTGPCV